MPDVQPIPEGYPRVSPYLTIDGAAEAIEFYTQVLGATERMRMPAPGAKIGHAELQFGDSVVMLSDEWPEMNMRGPKALGGTAVTVGLYVDDVDAVVAKAVEAGAEIVQPVENQFYGDRSGQFVDPFGHRWNVSTHVEDVPPDEMARRMEQMMGGG